MLENVSPFLVSFQLFLFNTYLLDEGFKIPNKLISHFNGKRRINPVTIDIKKGQG
jgi:hypothetical protein